MKSTHANIGLSTETISTVHEILRKTVSNESLYQIKLKQFHWNVKGENFSQYHELFETMYLSLTEVIDDTAERIRALGIDCIGTMQSFLEYSTLSEHSDLSINAQHMIQKLLADEEQLIQELRKDIKTCADRGDDGNADFLTGVMQRHEKSAWMLRATLS